MAYGELYIEPERREYNALNGRFLKGHTPHNKGKKWSEYATKRAQKKMQKGWKNLEKHRNKNGRPDTAGRSRKAVIAAIDAALEYLENLKQ